MMAGNPNTIFVERPAADINVRERLAVAAFTPGHLLEVVAGGYQKHSTAAGNAQKIFAEENLADARDIDEPYVANETARGGYAMRGDLVYAWVAAAAPAIAIGAALESAGDGTLRAIVVDANTSQAERDSIVGYAAEAVDNSGGASEARIQVEVA